MMIAETIDEKNTAEKLQESLLDPEDLSLNQEAEPLSSKETCQQRSTTTNDSSNVEPLEIVEQPENDGWIGVRALRCAWILFQCVWPALLLAFDWAYSYGDFIVKVIVPSALLFCFVAFAKKNNIREFRCSDVIPTLLWVVLPLTGDFPLVGLVALIIIVMVPVTIACFKHGPYETVKSGCDCLYYNVIVRPSNRLNCYKNLEDDFFEQQQEQEEAEQEKLEAQKKKLSYLEELEERRLSKTPIWRTVALVALGIWALALILYEYTVVASITERMYSGPH